MIYTGQIVALKSCMLFPSNAISVHVQYKNMVIIVPADG